MNFEMTFEGACAESAEIAVTLAPKHAHLLKLVRQLTKYYVFIRDKSL